MKVVVTVFSLLISFSAAAQITISNYSLIDTTQNFFYIGVDNIIKISGAGYDPAKQKHVLMGGGGTMFKKEKGVYTIRVQKETDDCWIWINVDNHPVFKKNFRVRNLGFPPTASINGLKDTTAMLTQLLDNPQMHISIPNCLYRLNFSVLSYKATFKQEKNNTTIVVIKNKPSEKQLQTFKTLSPGDKIQFDEIIASMGSFQNIKCLPFEIIIK